MDKAELGGQTSGHRRGIVARKIDVQGNEIAIISREHQDYISLTDIARHRSPDGTDDVVRNWLRNRNTIEFLGIWEQLNNPGFKPVEFDGFRKQAGLNSFTLTPKQWIEKTCAIGIVSKSGRYGGTYAHKDIAFEFASWISVEFKLYLIKEFQQLKDEELKQLGWDIKRNLAKINYRIHTVLNLALFGMTAKDWRDSHPGDKGNIRDYADVSQLVCLSNLENLNALFIQEKMPPDERLRRLNQVAIHQMKLLTQDPRTRQLEAGDR